MKLKYYLRGLGIGIIVTTIIMSFVRQPEKLTDAQIKLRAFELGMVEKNVLADFQEEEKTLIEKEKDDLIKEDMAVLEENPEETEKKESITGENSEETEENENIMSENSEVTEENITVSKEDTIVNSNESVEVPDVPIETPIEVTGSIENEGTMETSEKSEESTSGNVTVVGSFSESPGSIPNDILQEEVEENYVVIFIESGYSSEYASKKVKEAGLVESALEFKRYLVRKGLDKSIRAGNHEIPIGASMEEIAGILCRQE